MTWAVLSLLAAYNDHDTAAASALYAPDGEHHEVAQASVRSGRPALQGSLDAFLRAFPDAHWEIEGAALDSPVSAVAYRLTGVLAAPLGPFEPRGQALDLRGVIVARTDDEGALIRSTHDYWDSSTFARQMHGVDR